MQEVLIVLRRMLANEKAPSPDLEWLSKRIKEHRKTDPYASVVAPGTTPKQLQAVGVRLVKDARRRIVLLNSLEEDRRPIGLSKVAKQALWGDGHNSPGVVAAARSEPRNARGR